MIKAFVFYIIFTVSTIQSCTIGFSPVITTTKGQVQGCISRTKNNMTYYSYKGIRYAKTPVGRERFKPPLEVESWANVLNTNTEGSSCPQIHEVYQNYTGDEDCLYLNVYTPKLQQNLPVMVWIHGGGFKLGAGNESIFGPDCFIENNIVFVSINYRLGALGFLALLHPDATGNAGLKDQNVALKWVQHNIASFGGDPQKVTLAGQSAGSISTCLHALSPMSKGLFRSVMAMSGTPLNLWAMQSLEQNEERAFQLGSLVGFETKNRTELLDYLYNVSPYDLVHATEHIGILEVTFMLNMYDLPFRPIVEGTNFTQIDKKFLPECPLKAYKSSTFSQLPVIIGFTKDEFLRTFPPDLSNAIDAFIEFTSKILYDTGFAELWRETCYRIVLRFVDVLTDLFYIAEIDAMQKILGQNYYYILTYDSPYALHRTVYNVQLPGAAHEDDNGYLFEMDKQYLRYLPRDPTKLDYEQYSIFRCKMCKLWSNFIIYNDPTPNNTEDTLLNVKWLPAGSAGHQLDLNKNLIMKPRQADLLVQLLEQGIYLLSNKLNGCNMTIA